jgi:hypothetical protein
MVEGVEDAGMCEGEGGGGEAREARFSKGTPPPGVRFYERAFDEAFCGMLDAAREDAPVSLASGNMLANRRFVRDEVLAKTLEDAMPKEAGVERVISDLRFIDYDCAGGFILPHVDGVRVDAESGCVSNASMLLYLSTVPEDEGGETEFLKSVQDGDDESSVLFSVRPRRGAMLVFPHDTPHVGRAVGSAYPKILLRGDLVVRPENSLT